MSAEEINVTRRSETTSTRKAQKYYGSTSVTGYPALLEMDHDSELGEEEEGYLLDEELAKSGLYKGAFLSGSVYLWYCGYRHLDLQGTTRLSYCCTLSYL